MGRRWTLKLKVMWTLIVTILLKYLENIFSYRKELDINYELNNFTKNTSIIDNISGQTKLDYI